MWAVVRGVSGTLVGGARGSCIVFGLREYFSTLGPWWQYALGGVYVLTILYLPMGMMGLPSLIRKRFASQDKDEGAKENGKKLAMKPS